MDDSGIDRDRRLLLINIHCISTSPAHYFSHPPFHPEQPTLVHLGMMGEVILYKDALQ
jgi:hypothetical protein